MWTAEGWRDACVPLTAIAERGQTMRVGTAIGKWPDHQFLPPLACFLWQSLPTDSSPELGLCLKSGTRIGMDRRAEAGGSIREYIECVRSVLKATPTSPASFLGTYYKVTDYTLFLSAPVTEFPIYLAGVNRLMIQLAASHTEGLILVRLAALPI